MAVSRREGDLRESGVPTFRDDKNGLWARSTLTSCAARGKLAPATPKRVWGWYHGAIIWWPTSGA